MDTYSLNGTSISPFCRGKLDVKTGKFFDSTPDEIVECCISSCSDRGTFCLQKCGNNKRCLNQCKELQRDCELGCKEICEKEKCTESKKYATTFLEMQSGKEEKRSNLILIILPIFLVLIILLVKMKKFRKSG